MRKKLFLLLALGLGLILGVGSASAQFAESPFLQLLARIPDTPTAHDYLTYVDYRALIAARPGAPNITSLRDFKTIQGTKAGALFMSALDGIASGPQFYSTSFAEDKDIPARVGFDLFDIERAVEYNEPPATVTLLQGSFDSKAIINAHEARGYTVNQTGDFTLLCGANGCYQGTHLDLSAINPANPFGGDVGRTQPVLVGDQLVASSPAVQNLTAIVSAASGEIATLADQPDYHAAAEAITANGTLIQTYFINPPDILPDSSANTVLLPAYNLVALADNVTATEQQALVALVYTTQADAQAAAALFPDRFSEHTSILTKQKFSDIFSGIGVTSMDTSVYAASTDRYVMVLTLHAPLPSSAIPAGAPGLESSSRVYAVLAHAYMNRDLGWLATQS